MSNGFDKIYAKAVAIRFKLSIVLLTVNSGAVVGSINFIVKILTKKILLRSISFSLLFFIIGIILSLVSIIQLKKVEELNLDEYKNEELKKLLFEADRRKKKDHTSLPSLSPEVIIGDSNSEISNIATKEEKSWENMIVLFIQQ